MSLGVSRQVGSFRKVLPKQAIGVLIGTALPGALRSQVRDLATVSASMLCVLDDVDAMVLYDRSIGSELVAHRLMTEHLVPLCSPAIYKRLRTSKDLIAQTLIHTETKIITWPMWLRAAGIKGLELDRGLRFNRADLALEAAKAGLGVALESQVLAEPHIANGSLMIPFQASVKLESEGSYFFATRPATAHLPKVDAFSKWIIEASRQL